MHSGSKNIMRQMAAEAPSEKPRSKPKGTDEPRCAISPGANAHHAWARQRGAGKARRAFRIEPRENGFDLLMQRAPDCAGDARPEILLQVLEKMESAPGFPPGDPRPAIRAGGSEVAALDGLTAFAGMRPNARNGCGPPRAPLLPPPPRGARVSVPTGGVALREQAAREARSPIAP